MEKETIYCFDFDGTLTTKDTLIEFIRFAKGDFRTLMGFLQHLPILILMKLHCYPNWEAKQKIFSHFFKDMPIYQFQKICNEFAKESLHLMRPAGVEMLRDLMVSNQRVIIVSASVEDWVQPFFKHLGLEGVTVLGTRVDGRSGILTGAFSSNNCYGREKVFRIEKFLHIPRSSYELVAFGDSRGDKEMLEFSDYPHYKPFRT